jgi:hypothetical protein
MSAPVWLALLLTKFKSDIAIETEEGEYSGSVTDILVGTRRGSGYECECHFRVNGPDEESVETALLSFQEINAQGIDELGHDIGFSRDFRALLENTHPHHEYLERFRS